MPPLAERFCKTGPSALLICLVLCGIRSLFRLRGIGLSASHTLLNRWTCVAKKLLAKLYSISSTHILVPRNQNVPKNDNPYILGCLSMPQNFSTPDNSEQLLSIPTHLDEPTIPTPQGLHVEPNADQATTSQTQARIPTESAFESHPPEPFSGIHPIAAAQLLPRRWPIPREQPPGMCSSYTHPLMTPKNAAEGYIPSYTTNYIPDMTIPGWTTLLHPQGPIYFYREEKNVLTNANLFDRENYRVVEETIEQLFQKLEHDSVDIPPDTQLVIDIRWDRLRIGYYFATFQGRCLFWAHEKYVKALFKRVENVWSHTHIGHVIEAELWLHYQLFPHIQVLPLQLLREVKGFLLFVATDQVFNAKTTSEYSVEEVDKALGIINSIPPELIDKVRNTTPEVAYYTWIVGSIMALNALHRFDHYHGQPNARWLRDDFLFTDTDQRSRTPIITLLSPILFYTPETYFHSLRHIMNDGNIFFEAWRSFVVELHQEWNGLIIIATVLLATNIAFLAIPSLDNGDHPEKRSPAQICSYLSIILSVGSIVLGQLFSRYHRIKGWEHFDERITENFELLLDVGCSKPAIMYSLPYASLSWSLIAFLVAFLIMCFDGTQELVRLIIGIPSAVIALVMAFCISTMRSNDEERSTGSFLAKHYQRLGNFLQWYSSRFWTHPVDSNSTELQSVSQPRAPSMSQISNV